MGWGSPLVAARRVHVTACRAAHPEAPRGALMDTAMRHRSWHQAHPHTRRARSRPPPNGTEASTARRCCTDLKLRRLPSGHSANDRLHLRILRPPHVDTDFTSRGVIGKIHLNRKICRWLAPLVGVCPSLGASVTQDTSHHRVPIRMAHRVILIVCQVARKSLRYSL